MEKPHKIFYSKELPAAEELNLCKEKPVSDKELSRLLKKPASKKSKTKKAA